MQNTCNKSTQINQWIRQKMALVKSRQEKNSQSFWSKDGNIQMADVDSDCFTLQKKELFGGQERVG